jgi:hypothetical protein
LCFGERRGDEERGGGEKGKEGPKRGTCCILIVNVSKFRLLSSRNKTQLSSGQCGRVCDR